MAKEIGIGAALAGIVFLAASGYDMTPIFLLAIFGATIWFIRSGSQLGKRFHIIGSSKQDQGNTKVFFDDIGGQEVAKRELLEALEFIVDSERSRKLGIRPLRGILLTGPPGTGKTLLAKAAANHTKSVFVASSGSEFIEMYAGVGAQRVRQLFSAARSSALRENRNSAMIFIDEIEILGGKRGRHTGHLEYDQTLNQLLVEMDGINPYDDVRVLVIAATNRADLLDPALLRPGRFDRIVPVDLPDRQGRLHILKIHSNGKPFEDNVNLDEIARDTFGFSGAHLENLINEAAILSMRKAKTTIGQEELREAIDKVIMGEKLDRRPTEEEMERIAYHEVGHGIVSEIVRPGSVSAITVMSRGQALGYTRQSQEEDYHIYTSNHLEDQIAILLAGSVAEELVFGSKSTGSSNDFEQALEISRKLIGAGMSKAGIVSIEELPKQVYYETIGSILKAQEERALLILKSNLSALKEISAHIIEAERIEGEDFRRMLGQVGICMKVS
ncbi:MAG: AAA family ATPase [Firmicutes bacterium]|nr:AAA family ATPase [Bacillota bacterium]